MLVRNVAALSLFLAAGTAQAQNFDWVAPANGDWSLALNWGELTQIPDVPGESATISVLGTYGVALDVDVSIDGFVLSNPDATLNVESGRDMFIGAGPFTNEGLIVLNSNGFGSVSALQFDTTQTILGSGVIRLATGSQFAQVNTGVGAVVTNGAPHTIKGRGRINAAMINEGLITTDGAGDTLTLMTNDKTNRSLIHAATGSIEIDEITITQDPGARMVGDLGDITFVGGASEVRGGTIEGINGGAARLSAGTSVLTIEDVELIGLMEMVAGSDLLVTGTGVTNNGTISVNSNGIGSPAVIDFPAGGILGGTGLVRLNVTAQFSQLTGGGSVTQTATHSIRGRGRISAPLINMGVVDADSPGGTLELIGTTVTNTGDLSASTGTLEIDMTAIDNTGGTITANAPGTVTFPTGISSVSGGSLESTGGGIFDLNSSTATVTFDDLTLNADVDMTAGADLLVTGFGLLNNGTLTINDSGSGVETTVEFSESGTLSGTGTVVMNINDQFSTLATAGGATITHAAPHEIRGRGHLNASLINNSQITADITNHSLTLQINDKTNNGTMTATNNGVLELDSITVDNTNGTIRADDGTVRFASGTSSVVGGTLVTTGSGLFDLFSSASQVGFDSVVLNGDLDMTSGSDLFITGAGLVNNGTVTINDAGSGVVTVLEFSESGTLSGTGTVVMNINDQFSILATAKGATITHAAPHLIRGRGHLNASLINNSQITADIANHSLTLQVNDKTNNGTMTATNNGILEITGITVTNNGLIEADGGKIQIPAGEATIVGGTLRTVNGGLVDVITSSSQLTLENVTLDGDMDMTSGADVFIRGGGLVNNGLITVNDAGSGVATVLRFDESGTLDGPGRVHLNVTSQFAQLNTDTGVEGTIGAAQTVSGIGQLNGSFKVLGTVSPGSSVGTLTNTGTITFEPGSVLEIEASGGGSTQVDRLLGTADYVLNGGTVDLSYLNSFDPTGCTIYTIITGNSVTGKFDAVTAPPSPSGFEWHLVYGPASVDLRLTIDCDADFNRDCLVNTSDFISFLNAFVAEDPRTDFAFPFGTINTSDFIAFLNIYNTPCN